MIRLIVRLSLWLLALLALPVLLWWIYNRLDEAPSAQAARLAVPFDNTLADADNAWLYLLGMDAAQGDSPVSLGRRRIDAYEDWVGKRPRPSSDVLVDELFSPQLRVTRPTVEEFGVDRWCPIRELDCIDWAARRGQMLFRMTQPNLPLLQRYLAVLDMPRLEELATPNLDAPAIDFEIAQFHRNLLAQSMLSSNMGPTAIEGLEQAASFWRRVYRQARSLQLKLQASHQLEMSRRLFSQAMDRDWFDAKAFAPEALAALLDPPTAEERDWSEQARHEFQRVGRSFDGQALGSFAAWRLCRRDGGSDCAATWAMGQAYAHQATLNMRARVDLWILDSLHAEPSELESVMAQGSAIWDDINPLPDSMSEMLGALAYNMTGRTLVAMSFPSLDFVRREHDREALRRMLVIKYDALQRGIPAQDMFEHLDEQPPTLRNPRSGEVFSWDPVRQEIRYPLAAPGSESAFLRARLATAIADSPMIEVCATPWWIELSMVHVDPQTEQFLFDHYAQISTCGTRVSSVWMDTDSSLEGEPPYWDIVAGTARTYSDPDGVAWPAMLPLSVYFDVAAQQRHELLSISRETTPGYIELRGSDAMIHHRLIDPPPMPLLSLRVRNLPLPEVAAGIRDALAAASMPGLAGIERLSAAPILSIERDMPIEAALRHLLDRHNAFASSQLELRRLEDGGYAFAFLQAD